MATRSSSCCVALTSIRFMNSTQKLGSGSLRGHARKSGRVIEPGKAEDRVELDQQAGHKTLDCRVQSLQVSNRAFVSDHERASQSFYCCRPWGCGSPLVGEPMGPCGLPR